MSNYYTPSGPKVAIYGIVIFATFLIMAFFIRNMSRAHDPGPVNQARAEERARTRVELAKSSREALTTIGEVDKARGIVRLPISVAMRMTVQNYQDPQAGRQALLQRVEKATAPLPQAPEQPSEFE